ncbi:MAG: YggS family pyridoxal phosphate-dependent enzyme [Nitrospirales bacterium]
MSFSSLSQNIQKVMQSIHEAALRVGRDPNAIQLVAATKTVPFARMREGHEAGIQIFGENRLQEAQPKQRDLRDLTTVSWHFIGQVQRRKIKDVVGAFDLIHSVENSVQAREMDKRSKELGIKQDILLQVNVSGEATKGGYAIPDLMESLPELAGMRHLAVKGLMTIPPWTEDVEAVRPYFRTLRELSRTIDQHDYEHISMNELSMGMSQDYTIAVEEGATLVRVGSALFGARPLRAS